MKWTWVQNKPRLCIWVKLFVKKENEKQHLMDQLLGLMNVFENSDVSLYPGCCFKLTLQALNTVQPQIRKSRTIIPSYARPRLQF